MPQISPEGFLEMKAEQKALEQSVKKEQDLQRMAMFLPDEYFTEIAEQTEFDSISTQEKEVVIINSIKNYFNKCIATTTIPTISGMASCLGTTRKALKEYSNKNTKVAIAIRKGFQAISAFAEEGLLSGKPPQGLIFWLKNNDDYVDAHEVKHDNKTIGEIMDDMKSKGELIDGNDLVNKETIGEILDAQ